MSDNKLLSENTIRRFMKLANVDSLSDNFLDTLQEKAMKAKRPEPKHEDDLEEGGGYRGKDEDDLEEGMGYRGKDEDDLEEGMGYRGKDEDELEEAMHGKGEDELEEAMHGKAEDDDDEVVDLDDDGDDEGDDEGMPPMGAMDADAPVGSPGQAELAMTDVEAKVIRDLGKRIDQIMPDEGDVEDDEMTADMDIPSPEDAAADLDGADPMGAEERDEIVQEVLRRVTQRIVEAKLRGK